jgi:DNA-binding NarL/FixJ family response regulator
MEPISFNIAPELAENKESRLSALALIAMADHLEAVARAYRQRAEQLQAWEQINSKVKLDAEKREALAEDVCRMITTYLQDGKPYHATCEAVAKATGTTWEFADYAWRQHLRADRDASRQARIIEVMRLARQGLSNKEIAAQIGIIPSSVSRIIQHQIRKR